MLRFLFGLILGAGVSVIGLGAASLMLPLPYYQDGLPKTMAPKDSPSEIDKKASDNTEPSASLDKTEPSAPLDKETSETAPKTATQDAPKTPPQKAEQESMPKTPEQVALSVPTVEMTTPLTMLKPEQEKQPESSAAKLGQEVVMFAPSQGTAAPADAQGAREPKTGWKTTSTSAQPDTLGALEGEGTRAPTVPDTGTQDPQLGTPGAVGDNTMPKIPESVSQVEVVLQPSPADQPLSEASADGTPQQAQTAAPEPPENTAVLQEIIVPEQLATPELEKQESGF